MDALTAEQTQGPGRPAPPPSQPIAGPMGGGTDFAAFAREADGLCCLELQVTGARCGGCIARIEGALLEEPGVETARLNLSTGRLAIAWNGPPSRARALGAKVAGLGYELAPFRAEAEADARTREERELLRCLAVAGFAAANVMLLSVSVWSGDGEMGEGTRGLLHWLSALIALPAAAYAGRPFFRSAAKALRAGHVNMDVPISLAVLLACGLSIYESFARAGDTYFDAAVMLLFFLLIGRFLDARLRARAGAAARRLLALQATSARLLRPDGTLVSVRAEDLRPGDAVLIASGERVPVDGELTAEEAHLDTALVTGEAEPRRFAPGEAVYSGMVNLGDAFPMRAGAKSADSLLAEIARLVEAGQQARGRYVRFADRAAKLYVPLVHGVAGLTLLGWLLAGGSAHTAIVHAIAVLIITCPCALGLAVPAVQVVATGRLFRSRILVKSGDALERLASADYAVFDKTGTLTLGHPVLANADGLPEAALETAARLARASRHPLSCAVVAAAGPGPIAEGVREVPGLGLEGTVDGRWVRFGARGRGSSEGEGEGEGEGEAGGSEAWLEVEGAAPIRFAFAESPRADAAEAVRTLAERGLISELLSGDRPEPVERLARALHIPRFEGGLSPQEKLARIETLGREGRHVLMVGDGLNDAPALAAAAVSIAPAGAAEVSQSAADIVLQGDRLAAIPEAVDVARAARARVFENFALAAGYNAIAVPLAVFGFVTPLVAAVAMSASSLLVTLNALRLAR